MSRIDDVRSLSRQCQILLNQSHMLAVRIKADADTLNVARYTGWDSHNVWYRAVADELRGDAEPWQTGINDEQVQADRLAANKARRLVHEYGKVAAQLVSEVRDGLFEVKPKFETIGIEFSRCGLVSVPNVEPGKHVSHHTAVVEFAQQVFSAVGGQSIWAPPPQVTIDIASLQSDWPYVACNAAKKLPQLDGLTDLGTAMSSELQRVILHYQDKAEGTTGRIVAPGDPGLVAAEPAIEEPANVERASRVVIGNLTTNDSLANLLVNDKTVESCTSLELAKLLGVTPGAVRRTPVWKAMQQRRSGCRNGRRRSNETE